MTKSRPSYRNILSDFVGDLRSLIFPSQNQAAIYFHLTRPTITRYENGTHTPPLGYLTCLVRLLAECQDQTISAAYQQKLLDEVNRAIDYHYEGDSFKSWDELCLVADEYLNERQSNNQVPEQKTTLIQPQPLSFVSDLAVTPAEPPPLPYFYIERETTQKALLEKIKDETVRALVLWGTGGTGKSTLAMWLAQTLTTDFPDGQIWIELPSNLTPADIIREVQAQMARRFGVRLSSTSLAERTGQLRTLFQDKQCLLILDDVWQTSGLKHVQILNQKVASYSPLATVKLLMCWRPLIKKLKV